VTGGNYLSRLLTSLHSDAAVKETVPTPRKTKEEKKAEDDETRVEANAMTIARVMIAEATVQKVKAEFDSLFVFASEENISPRFAVYLRGMKTRIDSLIANNTSPEEDALDEELSELED
jgi:TorA maturation chaperone TorD